MSNEKTSTELIMYFVNDFIVPIPTGFFLGLIKTVFFYK
jgi:hypothetical protein